MSKLAIRPSTIGLFNPSGRVVPGGQRIPKTPSFLKNRKKLLKTQKLKKHLEICQN